MAVYKVPQNVEAEDKLIGFLTFKQFIYAVVAFLAAFLAFQGFRVNILLGLIPTPIVIVFSVLAFYQRPDQSIESYLIALLRFYFVPRRRLWLPGSSRTDVTITAPKKQRITRQNPYELQGQLRRLGQIMDTRGWSSKRAEITIPDTKSMVSDEERLIIPRAAETTSTDITQTDDILDESNQLSQAMQQLSEQSAELARQAAVKRMNRQIKRSEKKTSPETEEKLKTAQIKDLKEVHYDPYPSMHQKSIKPIDHDAIVELANNNPNLPVSELASQAKRLVRKEQQE